MTLQVAVWVGKGRARWMDGEMGGDGRTVNRLGKRMDRWMVEEVTDKWSDREGNVIGMGAAERL